MTTPEEDAVAKDEVAVPSLAADGSPAQPSPDGFKIIDEVDKDAVRVYDRERRVETKSAEESVQALRESIAADPATRPVDGKGNPLTDAQLAEAERTAGKTAEGVDPAARTSGDT